MASGARHKSIRTTYRYEPEADVLSVEFSKQPIDYATEMGNLIVHFSPKGKPVLIEILNAARFADRVGTLTKRRLTKGRSKRQPA